MKSAESGGERQAFEWPPARPPGGDVVAGGGNGRDISQSNPPTLVLIQFSTSMFYISIRIPIV